MQNAPSRSTATTRQHAKPYMQPSRSNSTDHERMLLDALMKLKEGPHPVVSAAPAARASAARTPMNINGKNGLACLTNMLSLPGPIVLKLLPGLPVIRDLIVDMTQFFKQYT